jgi:uncharacterized protein YodC (DUF2158 family)
MKNTINLELPIKIKPTVNNDGYVITDANETEHFFYEKESESEDMVYDGRCSFIKDVDLHVNDRMENKDIANEVAKIINESNCIEEAIKFSNSNDENNGAYLAFVAGAHFIVKYLKENDMKEVENNSNTDETKKAWHEGYNNWIFVGDRQPKDAFMCIVKMFNEFSDTWSTGTGIFDNGKWEATDSSGESWPIRYWRRCPEFEAEGCYVDLKEDIAKIYAKNKDFDNLSETQIGGQKHWDRTEDVVTRTLDFNLGDLVVLKSDATKVMTVSDVNSSYAVECMFWSNDQMVQVSFPVYTIEKI